MQSSPEQKVEMLRDAIRNALNWIQGNFDDADFIAKAKGKLEWLAKEYAEQE